MMFPFKTATAIEQQERKADIAYLDAQLALKASLAGDTFTGAVQLTAGAILGENAIELTGVDINGTVHNAYAQVTNVGGAHESQLILNRHSTTLQPMLLGVRSNSETPTEAAVTAGQELLSLWGAGYAGLNHKLFGKVDLVVGTGTVSNTSAPGKLSIKLTPDGSITPAEVLSLESTGVATFAATPVAPTVAAGTSNTQLATTAFVQGEISSGATVTGNTAMLLCFAAANG